MAKKSVTKVQTSKGVATISTRRVGQSFGVRGEVRLGKELVHETRLFGHGMDAHAYQAAYDHAMSL